MVFWVLLFGLLLITNFLNGFVEVILGIILYDLGCFLHADLQSLSYLFLAFPLGFIPGFATSHFIISRCRPFLILFVLILSQSLALLVLPLVPVIYVTAGCVFIFGLSNGLNTSVVLYLLDIYWAGSSRRVYLMLSMFSAGSVCCPLILQPFLSDDNLTQILSKHGILSDNFTYHTAENTSSRTVLECQVLWQYPCYVIAFIGVCVSFSHIIFHLKLKDEIHSNTYGDLNSDTDRIEPSNLQMIFILLFFFPSFPMTFTGLLTSYGTSGPQIQLSTLNMMLSVFWACFLVGRVLPAFLPINIKQSKILWASLIGQFLGGMLLFGIRFSGEWMLWSSCVLLGSSGGAYFPTALAWSAETIKMNTARKSICLTSMASGFLLSYICGSLMHLYGYKLFNYFIFCTGVYSGFIFLLLTIMLKNKK